MFETDSLSHVSPATISRMGILFMRRETITVEEMIMKSQGDVTHDTSVKALGNVVMGAMNMFQRGLKKRLTKNSMYLYFIKRSLLNNFFVFIKSNLI